MPNALPTVVCDDSNLARKQMARSLQPWNLNITLAENGSEAIAAIKAGRGHLMFLDLNMPVMDGYQVLETIRNEGLDCLVIVVSADIQDDAKRRVTDLGAMGFINKPIHEEKLREALRDYGLLADLEPAATPADIPDNSPPAEHTKALAPVERAYAMRDVYQEISNVAMGHATQQLATQAQLFIHQPIPQIQLMEADTLRQILWHNAFDDTDILSQGFIASGIGGEILVLASRDADRPTPTNDTFGARLAELNSKELKLEITNILTASFVKHFGEQLHLNFHLGAPVFLTSSFTADSPPLDLPRHLLNIEIEYRIPELGLSCILMMLFDELALKKMNETIALW